LNGDRIQGTPTTAGSFAFQVIVIDNGGCTATRNYTIKVTDPTICQKITIGPTAIPSATVGQLYSSRFVASGGTSPYALTINGSVPPGLGFVNGTLTGFPNRAGTFGFDVVARDAKGCVGSAHYELNVREGSCAHHI